MEMWFIYALVSMICSGVYSFLQKIAIERGYAPSLINAVVMATSAFLAMLGAVFYADISGWLIGLSIAIVTGITFMIGSTARLASLKYLDTSIVFPIYKTIGPLLMMVFGFLFFNEWFTNVELFGLLFGIAVPLLLISNKEKDRQKNLTKGLVMIAIAAVFAAISSAIDKFAVTLISNLFLFMMMSEAIGSVSGFMAYYKKDAKNDGGLLTNMKNKKFVNVVIPSALFGFASYASMLMAFKEGGPLAMVYTINSFYILIPIVLSIIIYKEHWNARKAFAIGLSIVALAFLR